MNHLYPWTTAISNWQVRQLDIEKISRLTLNAVKASIRLYKLPLVRTRLRRPSNVPIMTGCTGFITFCLADSDCDSEDAESAPRTHRTPRDSLSLVGHRLFEYQAD